MGFLRLQNLLLRFPLRGPPLQGSSSSTAPFRRRPGERSAAPPSAAVHAPRGPLPRKATIIIRHAYMYFDLIEVMVSRLVIDHGKN